MKSFLQFWHCFVSFGITQFIIFITIITVIKNYRIRNCLQQSALWIAILYSQMLIGQFGGYSAARGSFNKTHLH